MENQPTIGIIGGGQLGRMLTIAALPLGFQVIVLDPGENGPAVQVGARQITGDLYDPDSIRELAEQVDFVTIEIEHLNTTALEALSKTGKVINPAPATIAMIQDKFLQKLFLEKHHIPVAPFVEINDYADAKKALDNFGGKMILKAKHGAYDGRGNHVVSSLSQIKQALEYFADKDIYAEQMIPFKKELAVLVARSISGEVKLFPVVETVHERNICLEVQAPAQVKQSVHAKAERLAKKVASNLEGAGVFCIEMFLTQSEQVLVNEIAPRVHNSGHYTIEGTQTSQFEQHIRAVTGLPLGQTSLTAPAAVMINILGERDGPTEVVGLDKALKTPHTSVHIYGKSPTKIDRKMGHITATGKDVTQAQKRARSARKNLTI